MKKLTLLCLFFCLATLSHAQATVVSGTVVDPSNLAYYGSTMTITATYGGQSYLVPPEFTITHTDGSFKVSITPISGATYTFSASFPGIPLPFGTGPQTCTTSGVTISGSTQTVSFTCPALTNGAGLATGCAPTGTNGDVQVKSNTGCVSGVANPANVGDSGNIAVKNNSTDGVRYLSANGSDANDGLSWGTAKLTYDAAICSLPGGSCSSPVSIGYGTVYAIAGAGLQACSTDASYGIMIMNSSDPNYSAPPTCWMKDALNAGQALSIIGIGNSPGGSNTQKAKAIILQTGASNSQNKPAIWLSGGVAFDFENLATSGTGGRAIVAGECSDNTRTGTCQVAYATFENVGYGVSATLGNGPAMDVTGGSFQIQCNDCTASTTTINGTGSSKSAAIFVDGTNNQGPGGIRVRNFVANGGGGIKFIPGSSGGNVGVDLMLQECNGPCAPTVWITNTDANNFVLKDIYQADGSSGNAVQVDVANNVSDVVVTGAEGINCNVVGQATVLNEFNQSGIELNSCNDPLVNGKAGFYGAPAKVLGQIDAARRQLVSQPVQFTNKAGPASGWSTGGGVTVTTGISGDPAGGSNAARVAYSGAGYNGSNAATVTGTLAAGDSIVMAGWVRAPNGAFANGQPFKITETVGSCGTPSTIPQTLPPSTTNWQWISYKQKLTGSGSCTYTFGIGANSSDSTDVYGLVVNYIPNGTWDDQTVADYVANLSSYDSPCVVGTKCGTLGIPIQQGSYFDVEEIASPGNPATGWDRWFASNSTHLFTCLTSTGGNCAGTGGGSSITLQTNAANNASQSLLNFQNFTFNGLTFTASNPSGGIQTYSVGGTLNNAGLANPSVTVNTSAPLGGGGTVALGGTLTLTCATCVAPIFQTNSVNNFSSAGVNFLTSTANVDALTATPSNPSTTGEQVEISGTLNAFGGGTGVSSPTAHSDPESEGSSPYNFVNAGNALSGQVKTANNGADPSYQSPGLTDSANSPVITTPYILQCDSGTALVDRTHTIRFQSGAGSITVPLSTASGCPGLVVTVFDDNAGSLTFTRTGSDTFSTFNGATASDGVTSFSLQNGQYVTFNAAAPGLWEARISVSSAGSVSSFTGDGTLISNSGSTGSVTVTLANAGAHKFWGNNTGSSAAPGYEAIGTGDLPGSGVTTINGTSCTIGGSCTISGSGGVGTLFTTSARATVAGTTTVYGYITGQGTFASSETSYQVLPAACTAKNAYVVAIGTQPSTGSLTATLRDANSATNTALTVTIAANATTGSFTDLTHTVTLTAGDSYDWVVVNNASSTSITLGTMGFQCQ